MTKFVFAVAAFLFLVVPILAQPVTLTSLLAWDQAASDLPSAQGYIYRYYPDGAATGVALSGVVCVLPAAGAIFSCSVKFPAFTPGAHTLTLTAANVAGESVPSSVFAFTFVVVPGAPSNLRIQ